MQIISISSACKLLLHFFLQYGHIQRVLSYQLPLAYDRHVYFIDYPNVTGGRGSNAALPSPTWVSVVREPVAKFVSRYFYARDHAVPSFKKLLKRGVPYALNTTMAEWKAKGLDDCVLKKDPECTMVEGQLYDLMIVGGKGRILS